MASKNKNQDSYSCVLATKNRYFKLNHDVFLTLTERYLSLDYRHNIRQTMNLKSNIKKCKVSTDQWFAEVYIVNIYSGISVSSIIQLRGQRDVTIIQEMKCLIVKVSC